MNLAVKIALPIGALASCVAIAQTDVAREHLTKHAEVFKSYALPARSPRLEDLQPNPQGIIQTNRVDILDYMVPDPAVTETQELKGLAGRFDAILSGTTTNRYSAIDPTHTFLYSDWIVKVNKVYKNTSTMQAGSEITVTRLGGDLNVNGKHIIDKEPSFPEFSLNHLYLFCLKALPDTSSFLALGGATFDVTGATPVLLTDPRDPTKMRVFSSRPTAAFLAAVEGSLQ